MQLLRNAIGAAVCNNKASITLKSAIVPNQQTHTKNRLVWCRALPDDARKIHPCLIPHFVRGRRRRSHDECLLRYFIRCKPPVPSLVLCPRESLGERQLSRAVTEG